MQNERKIPWFTLILQTIYLLIGVYFHVSMRPAFAHVFREMDIEHLLSASGRLMLNTPLVIAVLGGMFLFFLWAWKYDRLENKFIVAFINLFPIIFMALMLFTSSDPIPLIGNLG